MILRLLVILICCLPTWAVTPPTIVSRVETTDWSSVGTPKTMTVSWLAGDVLVTACADEGADTLGVPTGTGLTYTSQESRAVTNTCAIRISTATPGADGTGVSVSVTNSSTIKDWGCVTVVLRGSTGVGNHTSTATPDTTKTISLTPTQADSYILWLVADFSAGAVGSATPTPTLTIENTFVATRYTILVADLNDQTSAGATSYGQSAGGTAGPFTIGAIEIKGTGAAGAPCQSLGLLGVGC